ncbi:MAG: hypothetical protein HC904_13945 [Blastochloris sp.]|nr:hypothetical protein [Blastochloris sp.]
MNGRAEYWVWAEEELKKSLEVLPQDLREALRECEISLLERPGPNQIEPEEADEVLGLFEGIQPGGGCVLSEWGTATHQPVFGQSLGAGGGG